MDSTDDTEGNSCSVQLTKEKSNGRTQVYCRSCDYVTDRACRLVIHEERHVIQSEHQCPLCTFSVPDKISITQHLRVVHRKGYLEIRKITNVRQATAVLEKNQQAKQRDPPRINGNEKNNPSPTSNVILKDKEEPAKKRRKTGDGPPCATEDNLVAVQGELMRTYQKRSERSTLVRSRGPLVCRQVYLCPELDCAFWAQSVSFFHDHLVTSKHGALPAYKCSACPFTAVQHYSIVNHIYSLRNAGNSAHIHSAQVICTMPLSEGRYDACLRFLAVPSDLSKGELADQGNEEIEKEVESLEAAIAEGFRILKDVETESHAKLKHLEDEERFVASTKALLLSEKEELNRQVEKLMSRKNKAETALKMETTSKLSIRVVTKELEGINQELKTTKEELANLTDRLEGGAALNKEIARQMTDVRKELADLEEEEKAKQCSRIASYKEKMRQRNQLRIQTFGFSLEAELNRKEVDWLAQLGL